MKLILLVGLVRPTPKLPDWVAMLFLVTRKEREVVVVEVPIPPSPVPGATTCTVLPFGSETVAIAPMQILEYAVSVLIYEKLKMDLLQKQTSVVTMF